MRKRAAAARNYEAVWKQHEETEQQQLAVMTAVWKQHEDTEQQQLAVIDSCMEAVSSMSS
jgi:hypothetical protein